MGGAGCGRRGRADPTPSRRVRAACDRHLQLRSRGSRNVSPQSETSADGSLRACVRGGPRGACSAGDLSARPGRSRQGEAGGVRGKGPWGAGAGRERSQGPWQHPRTQGGCAGWCRKAGCVPCGRSCGLRGAPAARGRPGTPSCIAPRATAAGKSWPI